MNSTTAWKVEIETSGGLTGRGTGGILITSDGVLQAATESKNCQAKLTPGELKTIARLISRARPRAWRPSYQRADNPYGGADQFQYRLRLTTGAETHETFWYDATGSGMPQDLRALAEAVWKARERAVAKCRS